LDIVKAFAVKNTLPAKVFNPVAVLLAVILTASLFTGCTPANRQIKNFKGPGDLYGQAMDDYLEVRYEEAEKKFKKLVEEFPLSPYSLEAELLLGDISYATEKYDEASAYYTSFVAMHPTHPRASYALFQKGMSYFRDVLGADRDQTSTRKALFAFEDLVKDYPGSPYYEKSKELIGFLRRRLADREFYIGRFYFKNKNYKAALSRFRDILSDYPEVGLTDQTLYYIGESYTRIGEKRLAEDAFTTLITDYPESQFIRDARERLNGYL